jgi:hypothetical protein
LHPEGVIAYANDHRLFYCRRLSGGICNHLVLDRLQGAVGKQNNLADLEAQLRLHELLAAQARDGPDAKAAAGMLETSRMLCREAAKGYNRTLHKPMNRFPALLMGFRAAEDAARVPSPIKP